MTILKSVRQLPRGTAQAWIFFIRFTSSYWEGGGWEPLFRMPLLSFLGFRLRTWAKIQRWLEHSYSLSDFAGCWKGTTEYPSEKEQWASWLAWTQCQTGPFTMAQWKEGWTSPEASHFQHPALSLREIISPNLGHWKEMDIPPQGHSTYPKDLPLGLGSRWSQEIIGWSFQLYSVTLLSGDQDKWVNIGVYKRHQHLEPEALDQSPQPCWSQASASTGTVLGFIPSLWDQPPPLTPRNHISWEQWKWRGWGEPRWGIGGLSSSPCCLAPDLSFPIFK